MVISQEISVESRRRGSTEAHRDSIDRLSDLPDSVIINILSFLETKDAVRTSVLSQQWRSLWTSVPTLSLSTRDFPLCAGFQRFVEKSLGRRHKLNKLLLDLRDSGLREHIDSWLQHAANRDVDTLRLDVLWNYRLPEFLFGQSSLTKLSTNRCYYEPRTRVSWESLTSLSIGFSRISSDALTSILSGSPVLQHLELISCFIITDLQFAHIGSCSLKKLALKNIVTNLKISAPTLEILEISDHLAAIGPVELLNLSALVEANLKPTSISQRMVLQLLEDVRFADKLIVGDFFCQVLSKVAFNRLCWISNCSVLHIMIEDLGYLAINKLLQISSLLQTLVINISEPGGQDVSHNYHKTCWPARKGRKYQCLKQSLKTVTINGFEVEGSKSLMILTFVEFLLREAQLLQKLSIYSAGVCSCESVGRDPKLSELGHRLLSLPRSSQSVVVAFHP